MDLMYIISVVSYFYFVLALHVMSGVAFPENIMTFYYSNHNMTASGDFRIRRYTKNGY